MILETLLWILFVLSALLLCLIILIQEGKGGGLAEAFGGQGAETFGVKATGVNYFTAGLASAMFISAILINRCSYMESGFEFETGPAQSAPGTPGTDGGGAPAPGGENK